MEAEVVSREPMARLTAPRGAFPLGAVLLGAGVTVAGAIALLGLDRLPVSVCYFKTFTGLPCMSCGGTRAAALLARLDPAAALAMNPLATLAGAVLVPWGLLDLALLVRGRALRLRLARVVHAPLRWGVVAALVVNWAYLIAAGR